MKKMYRHLITIIAIFAMVMGASSIAGADQKAATAYKVKVDSGYLALRSKPAYDSSNEIGQLYTGDTFYVMDDGDSQYWYGYTEDQKAGYVNKDYLVADTGSATGIAAGIKVRNTSSDSILETDVFELYLPLDIKWECEIVNENTLNFFYNRAKDAGYGGKFLTLKSYDWSANDYSDFPDWKIAGLSNDKKYVAVFPTDLQYDATDSVQKDEYSRLLSIVKRMDTESRSGDNPFHVK
ncbi:MAG: hypothetical protein Q4F83_13395 [Eubacteriales bacterium]|nr:hypothetical protein [Eubacteriales bacterium]